jgi:hypothetical protein
MEAALRSILHGAIGDFIEKGLEHADLSSFPLVLRDVQLNAKLLNHRFAGSREHPIELTRGRIGCIKVTPGWIGNIDVAIEDIDLSFSFSPTKALSNGMKNAMSDSEDPALAAAIAASLQEQEAARAPVVSSASGCRSRFCFAHDSSEKRPKVQPVLRECAMCRTKHWCSWRNFHMCPDCSDREQKCMICGEVTSGAFNHMSGQRDSKLQCKQHRCQMPAQPNQQVSGHHAARRSQDGIMLEEASYGDSRPPSRAFALNHRGHHAKADNDYGSFFGAFFRVMSSGDMWNACADDACRQAPLGDSSRRPSSQLCQGGA